MTLNEVILHQRALGNIPRFEPDLHRIEAVAYLLVFQQIEVAPGGMTKRFFFPGINRLGRPDEVDLRAGFDFDKDEKLAMTANEVDFTTRRFEIARQHPVTVTAQERARDALTIIPRLLRPRQPGRRRGFVSAQMFADVLGKVREG